MADWCVMKQAEGVPDLKSKYEELGVLLARVGLDVASGTFMES